jgi:hypothetical protein
MCRPVVSHHLDGFIRRLTFGFIAPRTRSWGSLRFGARVPWWPAQELTPTRAFPSPPRSVVHTLRRTPRQQPHRITAAVALLPFPLIYDRNALEKRISQSLATRQAEPLSGRPLPLTPRSQTREPRCRGDLIARALRPKSHLPIHSIGLPIDWQTLRPTEAGLIARKTWFGAPFHVSSEDNTRNSRST